MLLIKFRVQNFRSIEDSGDIDVAKLTSLVGRNESGKSNLLLALATLNPPDKRRPLTKIKDFPRSRRIEDCKPDTPVVWSWWRLERSETAELKRLLPTPEIEEVAIGRGYEPELWICIKANEPALDAKKIAGTFRRLKPVLVPILESLEDIPKANCTAAWTAFDAAHKSGGRC